MDPYEILIILSGVLLVFISYRISEHLSLKKNAGYEGEGENPLSFGVNEKTTVMNEVNELCQNTALRTEKELSSMFNERMMSFSEYSDMVMEQIRRCHEEVVFMYSMLHDKEEELKQLVTKAGQFAKKDVTTLYENFSDSSHNSLMEQEAQVPDQASQLAWLRQKEKEDIKRLGNLYEKGEDYDSLYINRKEAILALYEQGLSIVEISKELNMGQGEVMLVINLFCEGVNHVE